jgi:hypothetical protein
LVQFFTVFNSTGNQGQAVTAANAVVTTALNGIAGDIQALYTSGARKFLVWNVGGRIDLLPAVRALGPGATTVAQGLTVGFNQGLVADVLADYPNPP